MKAADIYSEYVEWRENPSSAFTCGKIVREGPASLAIIPDKNPSTIIKILKPNQFPFGMSLKEEFALLNKLQSLRGKQFIIPKPIAYGENPQYIKMSLVGESFGWEESCEASEVERIGRAVGEFAALLYMKHRAIHLDISPGNITRASNGKIGIIDIASIVCGKPEDMFRTPLLNQKLNLSPYIADEFQLVSGIKIDFNRVLEINERMIPILIESHTTAGNASPETIKKIIAANSANISEWQELTKRKSLDETNRPNIVRATSTIQPQHNKLYS